MANYQSARLHPIRHTITPPDRFVAFNRSLDTNDGLLVNYVATAESISFVEAEKKVLQFIRDCEKALEKEEVVILPEVGKLYQDSDRQIRFVRDLTTNHFLGSFGMEPIQFPPIVQEVQETTVAKPLIPVAKKEVVASKKPTEAKKKRRKKFRVNYYMVIILLLCSALVTQWYLYDMDIGKIRSVQFNNSGILDYFKGIIGKEESKPEKIDVELTPEGDEKITNEEDLMGLEPANFESPEPEKGTPLIEERTEEMKAVPDNEKESSKVEVIKEKVQPVEPVAQVVRTGVYVIIGSFKDKRNASKLASALSKEGRKVFVLPNPAAGNVRVGLGEYASRKEAEDALPGIRSAYQGAWLLSL